MLPRTAGQGVGLRFSPACMISPALLTLRVAPCLVAGAHLWTEHSRTVPSAQVTASQVPGAPRTRGHRNVCSRGPRGKPERVVDTTAFRGTGSVPGGWGSAQHMVAGAGCGPVTCDPVSTTLALGSLMTLHHGPALPHQLS